MRTILLDLGPMAHLSGKGSLKGRGISDIDALTSPAGNGIVVENGIITRIDDSKVLEEEFGRENIHQSKSSLQENKIYSLQGKAIIPGLVDAHTHLLWAGDRSREVSWRQQGHSYSDIASMGGGIVSTVDATRNSSQSELVELGYKRLRGAFRNGSTHLEIKSGYGLSTEAELKLLLAGQDLSKMDHLPSIDQTWLGAHATPKGNTRQNYVEEILSDQLPSVIDQGIARSADVFCEPGWFTVEESEDILKQSKQGGLDLRIHIDEFTDGGGGDLAADLKVTTADHAHYTSSDARMRMQDAGVNCGFLPGTPYAMGEQWPDFNNITEQEFTWSVATDFNPNCRTLSLPFIASILVQRCAVSPLAALVACSRNPAQTTPHPSGAPHGIIEEGAVANLNIIDGPWWQAWCQQPGDSPFHATMLEGELIFH
ncbi:MAG: imidazolonepropionase [Candidatus Poseidoniaceae archaeon]|nr:imidazolonepropionase [Candidatus Poseidoniaceae archaeon]